MKPQTIILIGRSGCGKGTQGKFLQEFLAQRDTDNRPIYYVETGAQFREFIKGDTHSSKLSKEIYDRDDRQPDFLAVWMWSHLFVDNLTGEEHIILDGTPRSLSEAMILVNALNFYGRKANVVFLDISRETAEKRLLSRGRMDDANVGKIKKRLDWYDRDVQPAVDYFKNLTGHNFIHANGEQDVEKVQEDIAQAFKIF